MHTKAELETLMGPFSCSDFVMYANVEETPASPFFAEDLPSSHVLFK